MPPTETDEVTSEYSTSDSLSVSDSDTDSRPVVTDQDPSLKSDSDFVYVNKLDPMRSLPGGVYLDDVERERAEIARAKVEGREPDLDNPPAIQSTPVVPRKNLTYEQKGVLADIEQGYISPVTNLYEGEPDPNAGAKDLEAGPVDHDHPTGKFDPAEAGSEGYSLTAPGNDTVPVQDEQPTFDFTNESNKD